MRRPSPLGPSTTFGHSSLVNALLLAIVVILDAGLVDAVRGYPELLRLVLGIGVLVLALRLVWRRLRNGLRLKL